ncbi:putative F420-non-reducing hydrogenase vhu iron-sulfur subunit D [Desulfarculales bacterium]
MRLQYPTSIKIIQLPGSDWIDILHILKSFEDGIDGVYVARCMEGDCHFFIGNLKIRRKVSYVKTVLAALDVKPERVEMFNVSLAEDPRFAQVAWEFTAKIKELGPNPVK